MKNQISFVNPESVAAPLYLASQSLREVWTAIGADERPHDETAPYSAAFSKSGSEQTILHGGQLAIMHATWAVLDYLRGISLSYAKAATATRHWPTESWPGLSCFALARGILEGCALMGWYTDPSIDDEERLKRGARILLWSLSEEQSGPNPPPARSLDFWRSQVEASGLRIRKMRRGFGIEIDGGGRTYSHQVAIRNLLPSRGQELYHAWSGLAHNTAWALSKWGQLRIDPNGGALRLSIKGGEDEHFEMLADIAEVISVAGQRFGEFLGRSTVELTETCRIIADDLRLQIPHIRTVMQRPN